LEEVPDGLFLIISYIMTFVSAESALLLMALREYVQDIRGLSDKDIIRKLGPDTNSKASANDEETEP
jgi:hypothetical protein